MVVCIHEDRPQALLGVKLLILSLRRHCPDVPVLLSCPSSDDRFDTWLRRQPGVERFDPDLQAAGWNVKPSVLLAMLDAGHEDVFWIDADIIVTGDFRPLLTGRSPETLVVTEVPYWEIFQGGTSRTRLWGLDVGRSLPCTINSGVVGVNSTHRDLLIAWQSLLADPAYVRAQARPMFERPIHMIGDQDVLTALLGARRFQEIPLLFLRRGTDIAQCAGPAGYAVHERIRSLTRGLPPLVHCIGPKPWDQVEDRPAWRAPGGYVRRITLEVSPYVWVARKYRDQLDEDAEVLSMRTLGTKLSGVLALGNGIAQGLPLAVAYSIGKCVKRILRRTPWPHEDACVGPDLITDGQRIVDDLDATRHRALQR